VMSSLHDSLIADYPLRTYLQQIFIYANALLSRKRIHFATAPSCQATVVPAPQNTENQASFSHLFVSLGEQALRLLCVCDPPHRSSVLIGESGFAIESRLSLLSRRASRNIIIVGCGKAQQA